MQLWRWAGAGNIRLGLATWHCCLLAFCDNGHIIKEGAEMNMTFRRVLGRRPRAQPRRQGYESVCSGPMKYPQLPASIPFAPNVFFTPLLIQRVQSNLFPSPSSSLIGGAASSHSTTPLRKNISLIFLFFLDEASSAISGAGSEENSCHS